MATFTTEEDLPFTFGVADGKGRPKPVDDSAGPPVGVSSDDTVATVAALTKSADGLSWAGVVRSVTPGTAHIIVTADADLGEGVSNVIAEGDVEVMLDPATGARIAKIEFGAPTPKA